MGFNNRNLSHKTLMDGALAISKRNIVLLFFAEIRLEQIGQKFMDSEISRGRVLQQFMPEIVTLSTHFCCNSPPLKPVEMQVVRWLWLQKKSYASDTILPA